MVLQLFLNPAFLKIAQVEIYTSAELCSNDNQRNEKNLATIICAEESYVNFLNPPQTLRKKNAYFNLMKKQGKFD
jgi:hypothetical protein